MKRGKRDRFTPNGIDCYFVTVMTDNRFKQQCRDDHVSFRRGGRILLFTPERSDFALLFFCFCLAFAPFSPRSLYYNFS